MVSYQNLEVHHPQTKGVSLKFEAHMWSRKADLHFCLSLLDAINVNTRWP